MLGVAGTTRKVVYSYRSYSKSMARLHTCIWVTSLKENGQVSLETKARDLNTRKFSIQSHYSMRVLLSYVSSMKDWKYMSRL